MALILLLYLPLSQALFLVAPAFWDAAGAPAASQRRPIGAVARR